MNFKRLNLKLNVGQVGRVPAPIRSLTGKFAVFLLPSLIVVVILILIVGVISPRIGRIIALRKENQALEQTISVLDKKILALKGLDSSGLLSQVRRTEIALPLEKDLPTLLGAVEKLAAESGLSIVTIQLTPGEISPAAGKGSKVEEFPVKVVLEGNFASMKTFLARINTSQRALGVLSASITSSAEATLSASLDVNSFYQPLAKDKPKLADPLPTLTAEEQKALERIPFLPPVTPLPVPAPSEIPTGRVDPFAPL